MGGLAARIVALFLILVAPASAAQPNPAPPNLAVVHAMLAGTWQSTDDTKFTRELDADGRSADRYEGDESGTAVGSWTLFLGSAAPRALAGRKFEPNGVYLLLDQNGDQLLFALVTLSPQELRMIYLERGNVLSFVRLK